MGVGDQRGPGSEARLGKRTEELSLLKDPAAARGGQPAEGLQKRRGRRRPW